MKPSTFVELAGFACLTAAAFLFGAVPGLITAGACLLLIGYGTEDNAAALSVERMLMPARRLHARHRMARAVRKAARRKAKQ